MLDPPEYSPNLFVDLVDRIRAKYVIAITLHRIEYLKSLRCWWSPQDDLFARYMFI